MHVGEAGRDRRGLWVDDPGAGVRIRLGAVGREMAMTLAEQGNLSAMRQVMKKPHYGLWFSKTF